jgi:hypothetical protein
MHTSIETLLTTNDAIGLYATSIRPQLFFMLLPYDT